ncbi:MAG: hypothetical protein HOP14_08560 [Acidobacteria bacterium]|nr:hypothetical protein [Acidobacteriota bacterium]
MRISMLAWGLALAVSTLACTAPPAPVEPEPAAGPAAAAPTYSPVLSLNEVMVYIINHYSHFLWDVDEMGAPPSDAQWDEIEHAAYLLAAGGHLTMMGGTGERDMQWLNETNWQKYSQDMANAGLAGVRAAQSKNTAAVARAGNLLVLSCIECHREYKLEVPDIWAEEYEQSSGN